MRELLYINDDIARAMIIPKGNTRGKKKCIEARLESVFRSKIITIPPSKNKIIEISYRLRVFDRLSSGLSL